MKRIIQLSLLLLAILLPATAAAYDFEVDGIYYNINGSDATVTSGDYGYAGDITIPETVTYNGMTYSVTGIGYMAFYNCSSLTSVTIGNSVTSIGDNAFSKCTGLTNIIIPNSVTKIYGEAFSDCSGLTSITIPNSVTVIEGLAFAGCYGLEEIIVESGNPVYDSRDNCNAIIETASNTLVSGCKNTVIPNTVTAIYGAFVGISTLTNIEIPNSVTFIGHCAFGECTGLTNIVIPNSVTQIGIETFLECSGLTNVTIGNAVTLIEDFAFEYCNNLKIITCLAMTPPNANSAFYNFDASLYVPDASLEAYQTTYPWNRFSNIIGINPTTPGDVDGDGEINISDVTSLIDMLLNGGEISAGADVDGDGQVNISDVTALIDKLLNGN